MSATITATGTGDYVILQLVTGYETSRTSRNIIHDLLDGGVGVVLTSPRPRSGTLELLFTTEARAFEALALHSQESTFVLAIDDVESVAMSYVVNGSVTLRLDDETRQVWLLSVGYQEVLT